MQYILDDIFRSDLDSKVLDYIKQLGAPDNISYGSSKGRFQAYLTYDQPYCKPCYGQSWLCENCPYKETGKNELSTTLKKLKEELIKELKDIEKEENV